MSPSPWQPWAKMGSKSAASTNRAKIGDQLTAAKSEKDVVAAKPAADYAKVIPQTDPAYRKYLDRFLAAEGQIEKLRADNERLQALALRQRQEYEAFVTNLTVKE